MLHAENDDVIAVRTAAWSRRGPDRARNGSPPPARRRREARGGAPRDRARRARGSAAARLPPLLRGVRARGRAREAARAARSAGEVTSHGLVLDSGVRETGDLRAQSFAVRPPIRDACAARRAVGGARPRGRSTSSPPITVRACRSTDSHPAGVSGIETRLALVHHVRRARRADRPAALGRRLLHAPGADPRARSQGAARARVRTPTSCSSTRTREVDAVARRRCTRRSRSRATRAIVVRGFPVDTISRGEVIVDGRRLRRGAGARALRRAGLLTCASTATGCGRTSTSLAGDRRDPGRRSRPVEPRRRASCCAQVVPRARSRGRPRARASTRPATTRRSFRRTRPTLLLGSHLDSVPNGGRYDGALGVVAALHVLLAVQASGLALPVALEAIDFTDEEGTLVGLLGSEALTGALTPETLRAAAWRARGARRRASSVRASRNGSSRRPRRDPASLAGYLELHIEQGPVLERAGVQIGVVTTIVGARSFSLVFRGAAGHAGTTPMDARRTPVLPPLRSRLRRMSSSSATSPPRSRRSATCSSSRAPSTSSPARPGSRSSAGRTTASSSTGSQPRCSAPHEGRPPLAGVDLEIEPVGRWEPTALDRRRLYCDRGRSGRPRPLDRCDSGPARGTTRRRSRA